MKDTSFNPKLYYVAPSDEQFEEVRKRAIELWSTMGDEPSYSKEKISRIENIGNIEDNFMYMVAMFDIQNQRKLAGVLSEATKKSIRDRMVSGGQPDEYNPF